MLFLGNCLDRVYGILVALIQDSACQFPASMTVFQAGNLEDAAEAGGHELAARSRFIDSATDVFHS